MDRSSRQRVRKAERLLTVELKKRDERRRQWAENLPVLAWQHATAVAAIALSGQPKVHEPLIWSWKRSLRHYGISVKQTGSMADQIAAARQLFPIIIGRDNESARFTEIFKTAPVWLLQFSAIVFDAAFLKFGLPNLKQELRWGSEGFEEARRWPSLPCGTMAAGDAIPRIDGRKVWIAMGIAMGSIVPFPDNMDVVDVLLHEDEEDPFADQDPLFKDMMFALDLDQKPENEWSAHEKRRMRVLAKRISRLTGQRIVV